MRGRKRNKIKERKVRREVRDKRTYKKVRIQMLNKGFKGRKFFERSNGVEKKL